ncbi:MAG: 4-hydroxy-tetrahydrodipicolinate reductase [Bdellovibrionaceae bacterium]|nr:4-hydroxy-tetrahydrodipicolinate reductase [Pseudobdellovibrionaceae bacterium]
MIYKVGLLGASGRMGLQIAGLLQDGFSHDGDSFELADAVSGSGKLRSIEGIPVRKMEEPPREPVHVWIDFSTPDASMAFLDAIETPIVIATTGFSDSQLSKIKKYADRFPVLLAPNTSPGMNLFLQWLEQLPEGLKFDLNLSEEHHVHKKDAPSGTAKSLLEVLERRGYGEVPVQSVRAGGIRGVHTLKFAAADETIEIRHEALDRKVFAEGALIAAAFLVKQKKAGLYKMADALGTRN